MTTTEDDIALPEPYYGYARKDGGQDLAGPWFTADQLRTAVLEDRKRREAQIDCLRAFAQGVMRSWPMGDVDGGALQDLAIKHGLLKLQEPLPTAPCGEHCGCAEFISSDEWADGIECYRKTPLLTGAQEGKTE